MRRKRGAVARTVIAFVEAVERMPVDPEKTGLPVGILEAVEVYLDSVLEIDEAMRHRLQPRMHDVTAVEKGCRFGLLRPCLAHSAASA